MSVDSGTGRQGYAEISSARLGKAQAPEMLEYVWTPFADVDADNIVAMVRVATTNVSWTLRITWQRSLEARE